MPRAIASLVALTLVVALTGPARAGAAGKKTEPRKLNVFKQWSGWYPYPKENVKLPWFEAKQEHRVIDNASHALIPEQPEAVAAAVLDWIHALSPEIRDS